AALFTAGKVGREGAFSRGGRGGGEVGGEGGVQRIQPLVVGGGDGDGGAKAQCFSLLGMGGGGFEVCLVEQRDDRFVQLAQALGEGAVGGEDAAGTIQQQQQEVGLGGGVQREFIELALQAGGGVLLDAGSIQDIEF